MTPGLKHIGRAREPMSAYFFRPGVTGFSARIFVLAGSVNFASVTPVLKLTDSENIS